MKTLHSLIAGLGSAFSIVRQQITLPLLYLGAGLALVQPCAGAPFEFEKTGGLITARSKHTATLLPTGQVLVAGGYNFPGGALTSAELYNPARRTWAATDSFTRARYYHTATLLPNGKVLVACGFNGTDLASAVLYDPASETWRRTGKLGAARLRHTATLLPNGKVLVAGGVNAQFFFRHLKSAELYDPTS